MQCKELEAVLESEDLTDLSLEAREHLARCPDCQNFVSDLTAIVAAAKRIPAEVAPPDRIWISVRTQLQADGIFHEAEPVVAAAPWFSWHNFAEFFRPRVLATVAAGLLVVAGSMYVVEHRGISNTVQVPQPASTQTVAPIVSQTPKTIAPAPPLQTTPAAKSSLQQTVSARSTPPRPRPSTTVLRPSPSEDAYFGDSAAVLSQTENALPRRELANNPVVDAALRQNLRTLDDFIAECQSRLKQNPQDELTREYLSMAYQQKAELLNAMMDSGRSEQ
jgi:hypothetical protein